MSTYEFYNITVHGDNQVSYEWICVVCGDLTTGDAPPDVCENCLEGDDNE